MKWRCVRGSERNWELGEGLIGVKLECTCGI